MSATELAARGTFDFLVTGEPAVPGCAAVADVEAFDHLELRQLEFLEQGKWFLHIVTEPKVWIQQCR